METRNLKIINKLAEQAEKASKIVAKNRFLIETYLSLMDAKSGRGNSHKSVSGLFRKLGI